MAISGFFFLSWRLFEIITLIPVVGMLAWFVHQYVHANLLTPSYVLVLFIVSVIALAWAVFTTIDYLRARHDAFFVALFDLGLVGALIAGVYYLRGIAGTNCTNADAGSFSGGFYFSINTNKQCAMLKASFAFAIIDIIAFFITFVSHSRSRPMKQYSLLHSCSLSWSPAITATTTVSLRSAYIALVDTADTDPAVASTAEVGITAGLVAPVAAITAAAGGNTTYERGEDAGFPVAFVGKQWRSNAGAWSNWARYPGEAALAACLLQALKERSVLRLTTSNPFGNARIFIKRFERSRTALCRTKQVKCGCVDTRLLSFPRAIRQTL